MLWGHLLFVSLVQAVLLVGFMPHEVDSFRSMMNDMDADIVKVGGGRCCG